MPESLEPSKLQALPEQLAADADEQVVQPSAETVQELGATALSESQSAEDNPYGFEPHQLEEYSRLRELRYSDRYAKREALKARKPTDEDRASWELLEIIDRMSGHEHGQYDNPDDLRA
jgi:hypothetical protein